MLDIKVTRNKHPKAKPGKDEPLGFGTLFTDHMFVMDYDEGQGWHDARIVPYENLSLSPACSVLHYGLEVFEGLKAYKAVDGRVLLFRPDRNGKRMFDSCERLCMAPVPVEDFVQAVKALVEIDKDWIPTGEGCSLYIRPFVIAVDPYLGVGKSSHHQFIIILSPSGLYYPEGLKPVGIWIEDEYVRAVRGGIGAAKTGGNYAASILAQDLANKGGYSQVLWLDGVERKYVEEVGAMNIFFKIDGKVVTPMLQGSILPGITRATVIELCKDMGYEVEERKVSAQELADAHEAGKLEEIWGTGTAAIISAVGRLKWGDNVMIINNNEVGPLSQKLYDTITGIQTGKIEDKKGWTLEVC
ncbi:MAG: branched-chain amino acid aminotransferase [Clostridiales bacterium]|nr:branched-chain amino acid aminotransferase [Clostridiales bacterium]